MLADLTLLPPDLKPWQAMRDAIAVGDEPLAIAYSMETGCPGTHAVVVNATCMPYPTGILYYRQATKGVYEILTLQVLEPLRRLGIGGKLLEGLEAIAKCNSVRALYTQDVTELSRRMIERAGFEKRIDGLWKELGHGN